MDSGVYKVEDEVIIFTPYSMYCKRYAWYLLVMFVFGFSVSYVVCSNISDSLSVATACLVLAVPVFVGRAWLLTKVRIVFDKSSRTIFRQSMFGRIAVASFDQVTELRLISPCMFVSGSQYIMVMKNEVYGNGMTLTYLLKETSPTFVDLQMNGIPELERLLFGVASPISATDTSIFLLNEKNDASGYFEYADQNYFALIVSILCFFVTAYLEYQTNLTNLYYLLPVLFSALVVSNLGRKVYVDTANQEIGIAWWNVKVSKWKFSEIENLDIVKTTKYGFQTQAIYISTNKSNSPKQIRLTSSRDNLKLDQLLSEVKQLIATQY